MRPRNLVGAQPLASGQLDHARGRITFWSFTETTGTATAEVRLYDGTGTGGALVVDIELVASESTRDYFPHPFVCYETGLYLDLVSGSVRGQVQALVFPDCDHWRAPVEVVNIGALTVEGGVTVG